MDFVRDAYRRSQHTSLTRVDVLVKLYSRTLAAIQDTQSAIEQADDVSKTRHQMLAYQCLVAILEGINPDVDETARNAQRLCLFALEQVNTGEASGMKNAIRVLTPLRDAFVAVRDQAAAMEVSGEIPPLELQVENQSFVCN